MGIFSLGIGEDFSFTCVSVSELWISCFFHSRPFHYLISLVCFLKCHVFVFLYVCSFYRKHWRWPGWSMKLCQDGSRWIWRKTKDCSSGFRSMTMCRWSNDHSCGVERDGTCMWCSLYSLCWLNFINVHMRMCWCECTAERYKKKRKERWICTEISRGLPASWRISLSVPFFSAY